MSNIRKVKTEQGFSFFDYIYIFVMVIYMSQINGDTCRMVYNFGGDVIPLLIPIVLTFVLVQRHRLMTDRSALRKMLVIITVWSIAVYLSLHAFDKEDFSYTFFLYYSIIIAYIHCAVFGRKLIPIFEDIVLKLSLVSLFFWGLSLLFPGAMQSWFSHFPETNIGNHFLYLYNHANTSQEMWYRNAGCAWEPGRFSTIVNLALYCNLLQNDIKLKGNFNFWVFITTIISTFSTTGFTTALVMCLCFILGNLSLKKSIYFIIFIPIIPFVWNQDFMGEKITDEYTTVGERVETVKSYAASDDSNEHTLAVTRFPSFMLDFENFQHKPILGYSHNEKHSYFYKNVSQTISLPGGLMKVLAQFGFFLGLFFYYMLYKSSALLAAGKGTGPKFALFLCICLSSFSYPLFTVPIFMYFWFYSAFKPVNDENS